MILKAEHWTPAFAGVTVTRGFSSEVGISILFQQPAKAGERVIAVCFSEDSIGVDLVDGRTITAPLAWYPRLLHATVDQRADWRIAGGG
jgi:hypothetical protein